MRKLLFGLIAIFLAQTGAYAQSGNFPDYVNQLPTVSGPLQSADRLVFTRGNQAYSIFSPSLLTGQLTTDGLNAVFPNIATNLSKWTTQIHQNTQTGACFGTGANRVLCASDQNFDLIADHSTIQSQDASMISSVTVGGSITANDVVGLNWTVASVLYQIRYTVQGGDTTSAIATNLAACLNAGSGAHCTVTTGFLNGLLAFHDANGFGYQPRASASGTKTSFDQPWAVSGNSVTTFLSGGATETLTLGANNVLDNGPYIATSRFVPGRTPVAADQLGPVYFQGQSAANSGLDTIYGAIIPRVLVQDPTNPQGELLIATSDSGSAKNSSNKIYIGSGVMFANSAGNGCGYPGLGIATACGDFHAAARLAVGENSFGTGGYQSEFVGGPNLSGVLGAAGFFGAGGLTPGVIAGSDNLGLRGVLAGFKYNGSAFAPIALQTQASKPQLLIDTSSNVILGAGEPIAWTSASQDASGTLDTGMSRTGAAAIALGNGTQGDFSGTLKLATLNATSAVNDNGTAPTGTAGSGYARATSPTLSAPVIATISNIGLLTLPTSTDTLVGRATADTFTNKTLDSAGTGNVLKISGVTVSAGQLPGTATNDNAIAGNIGQVASTNIPDTTSTVTITIASPGVVSWTSHGLACGGAVNFTTTGSLPTGITVGTNYYVTCGASLLTNSFQISTSVANAISGTSVNTSGSQSGTQTGISAAVMTNATIVDIAGVSLTAGQWHCSGMVEHIQIGGATSTAQVASLNTVSATLPALGSSNARTSLFFSSSAGAIDIPIIPEVFQLASTTTIFLSGKNNFSGGTANAGGRVECVRER